MDLSWVSELSPARLVVVCACALGAVYAFVCVLENALRWIPVSLGVRPIPRAPGGNVLFGHALSLASARCAWDTMAEWATPETPLVRFRILHRVGLIATTPADARRIFQTKQRVYTKDTDFSYRPFLSILGTGLVTANGKAWQHQRLLMAPAFRVNMLDEILPIAQRATDRLSRKLESLRGTGVAIDMNEEFRLLTLQVIGEAILSLPAAECDAVFPSLYLPVMEESNKRVLQPWRQLYPLQALQYSSRVRALDKYLAAVIKRRRDVRAMEKTKNLEETSTGKTTAGRAAAKEGGIAAEEGAPAGGNTQPSQFSPPSVSAPVRTRDILDRILDASDAEGAAWSPAKTMQLSYELKTFLLAGHETSAAMLAWTLYHASIDPAVAQKIRQEAETALPEESERVKATLCTKGAAGTTQQHKEGYEGNAENGNGNGKVSTAGAATAPSLIMACVPRREDVEEMHYALGALKESLRLYSVVPVVTRNVAQEDELSGYRVPKNSWVILHLKAVHHRTYADPLVFRPERFVPGGEYDQLPDDIRPYAFLPFTVGPRSCLGQYFALLEARVVLGLLLRRFQFTPVDAKKQGEEHPSVIPVGPINGMAMYVN